ncbi:cell division cycle-associated 7-like protein [Chanos chanos]|uniref:Cell division cycle-associated 7-like protein n=1 Tax=Chanos chanos TaxID=29144 RepID=A0A6J2WJ12_CHACN|nr:cell division cycle-associated 7-like protein [Chanos chanos]
MEIFESPSEDEDFLGFITTSSHLHSVDSWKTDLCFRSKFITDELAQIFTETDSEEEFEGFSKEDGVQRKGWRRSTSMESEQSSEEDNGFYSEEEAQPKRRSSGLCVAFRFPGKRNSTHKSGVVKTETKVPLSRSSPVNAKLKEKSKKRRRDQEDEVLLCQNGRIEDKSHAKSKETPQEDHDPTEASQILNKRERNIQENKAMLAKLFADLSSLPELSQMATPAKRTKKPSPKKRVSDVQSERRNPTRKARPPEHFGLEEKEESSPKGVKKLTDFKAVNIKRLIEVDEESREDRRNQAKRSRKHRVVRMPDDITEEELENVADRAKDKIHDKDNGSTCHQCRQKTLDTKTECRNPLCPGVKGQFCGPCLRNRYGEDVRTVLLDPTWECPICRGVCNCSLCRKRDGRCATGALTRMAKYFGHSSVRDYLEK